MGDDTPAVCGRATVLKSTSSRSALARGVLAPKRAAARRVVELI